MTTTFAPYTARQCPKCDVWVPEGTDYAHTEENHPETIGPIGFPYFPWNTETVVAAS